MAQNPIPGLTLPGPNAPERLNDNMNAILRWSKGISPRIYGVGTPIVGSNPPTPPSDAYLLQRGRQSVVFSGGLSDGVLTLPMAFPNGWLSLQLNGSTTFNYETSGATLQTINVHSTIGTGTFTVDFDALGW